MIEKQGAFDKRPIFNGFKENMELDLNLSARGRNTEIQDPTQKKSKGYK